MAYEIVGLDGVLDMLDKIGDMKGVEQGMENACAIVERTARQKAPKVDGDLRRSIESKIENNGDTIKGIVFSPLFYAPYVEYGTGLFAENGGRKDVPWVYRDDKGEWHITSGQHPQPYMRPALNENREKVVRMIKEAINK